MLSKLLFYRFLIFNTCVFVVLGIMEYYGWISSFIRNDSSNISLGILTVFFAAIFYQGIRAWKISKMIDKLKFVIKEYEENENFDVWQKQYPDLYGLSVDRLIILRDKDLKKISWMNYVAVWLVVMGLIGTVVGFIIATSGVPAAGIADTDDLNSLLGYLINGVSIALYTTLAGSVAGLIVEINAAKIHTALYNSWCDLIVKMK